MEGFILRNTKGEMMNEKTKTTTPKRVNDERLENRYFVDWGAERRTLNPETNESGDWLYDCWFRSPFCDVDEVGDTIATATATAAEDPRGITAQYRPVDVVRIWREGYLDNPISQREVDSAAERLRAYKEALAFNEKGEGKIITIRECEFGTRYEDIHRFKLSELPNDEMDIGEAGRLAFINAANRPRLAVK